MLAWGAQRGHMEARGPPGGGVATDGHLISNDPIALSVLVLFFGQKYTEEAASEASQHWYGNIASAAGAIDKGDKDIFTKGADLFDAVTCSGAEYTSSLRDMPLSPM